MATVWRHKPGEDWSGQPLFTRQMFARAEVCSFCGESSAAGYWRGEQLVAVCPSCAVSALAALAADSLLGESGAGPRALERLHSGLAEFQQRFWRAAAIQVHQQADPKRRCPLGCECQAEERIPV